MCGGKGARVPRPARTLCTHTNWGHAPLALYPLAAKICKQPGETRTHTLKNPMTSFNFQSVQTLAISEQDHPVIDVRDNQLVLTAQRGSERIMITAPLQSIVPVAVVTKVKTAKRPLVSPLLGIPKSVGTANGMAKLNDEAVKSIWSFLDDPDFVATYGSVTAMYKDIAKAFNVSAWAIKNIHEGLSWKHIKK